MIERGELGEGDGDAMGRRLVTDAPGFAEFFAAHRDRMVRSLCLALGDDQLGRDAAAEGFARALARWSSVRRMANPAGWVYRVGLNWARSRRRRTRRELSVERVVDGADPSIVDVAEQVRLRDALGRLSDDHRDVVIARHYLDWSEAQTAEALGVRPGTVKSRLSRAIRQLEREVAGYVESDPSTLDERGAPASTPVELSAPGRGDEPKEESR